MSYPGGKNGAGVYQTIINLMPPHEVYIEPFLGGAAVMRAKRLARVNLGVDLDLAALEAARVDSIGDCDGARGSGSPIVAVSAAIAGFGGARRPASSQLAMPDPLGRSGASSFRFYRGDGIRFLRAYPFTGRELVYCDPPYVRSARSSARDLYRYEMSDVDHRRLVRVLQELPCLVMVSGYWSALYAGELRGWSHVTYQSPTRGGHMATEWLWFNFAEPVELHDYRYLGSNFRERERIKRKKARWVGRLAKMPLLERQALLAAIYEVGRTASAAEPHLNKSSLCVLPDDVAAIAGNDVGGEAARAFFCPADAGRGSGKIFVTSQHGANL